MKINPINKNPQTNPNITSFGVKVPTLDVLQVATGHYIDMYRRIQGADYRVCEAIMDNVIFPQEINSILPKCRDTLKRRFPILHAVQAMADEYLSRPGTTRDNFAYWLQGQADTFGTMMDIEPLEMYKSKIVTPHMESVKFIMQQLKFYDLTKFSGFSFNSLKNR